MFSGKRILMVTVLGLTLGVISWLLASRSVRKERSPDLEYCL